MPLSSTARRPTDKGPITNAPKAERIICKAVGHLDWMVEPKFGKAGSMTFIARAFSAIIAAINGEPHWGGADNRDFRSLIVGLELVL